MEGLPISGLMPIQPFGQWCQEQDLNLRRIGLQPIALPTELSWHIQDAKEKIVGLEPTTDCF